MRLTIPTALAFAIARRSSFESFHFRSKCVQNVSLDTPSNRLIAVERFAPDRIGFVHTTDGEVYNPGHTLRDLHVISVTF